MAKRRVGRRGARKQRRSLLWGALLLAACSHYVNRGGELYYQGRYVEAAHVLEKSEPRLSEASRQERAAYGLFRGATLLRLGDLAGASHWLEYARELSAEAAALSDEQRELLATTLIRLRVGLDRHEAAQPAR